MFTFSQLGEREGTRATLINKLHSRPCIPTVPSRLRKVIMIQDDADDDVDKTNG